MLNRSIYVGVVETRCSTGDAKQRGQNNVISVQAPHLRIVPEDLARRVRARQAAARATLIRSERGHLISKPETSAVAKYLCNSIARCHLCGGPLIFVNKGGAAHSLVLLRQPQAPGHGGVLEHGGRSLRGPGARARAAADLVAVPAEASSVLVLSHPPADLARRLVQASRVEPRGRPVRVRPFPAHVDPAPAPEDPH